MGEMRKVVIHKCYGGFHLSRDQISLYRSYGGTKPMRDIPRDDPTLVAVVEEMPHNCLVVIEIPADVNWIIDEYDGMEWVAEIHRRWEWSPEGTKEF
jgi:hypothetical protein